MTRYAHESAAKRLLVLVGFCTIAISFAAGTSKGQNNSDEEVELFDYTVVQGDSCAGVASRELGERKAYRAIHKHNALGPLPHKLVPGSILRLPRAKRSADAILESRLGKVEYRRATEPLWDAANKGMDLFRAWRVWSHDKSTAVVVFRNNSSISMRDNTVVVIYGPNAKSANRKVVRAELSSGTLRTRLAALEGKMLISTASSELELEAGSTVIASEPKSERSIVSNHEGKGVSVRGKGAKAKAVRVRSGQGTWVKKGEAPAPPIDLPKAPSLAGSPLLHLGIAGAGVTLNGAWKAVPEAEKYRVEIATDPKVRIVIAAFEVPKSVTSFEARGIAPGRYYLSVASIDANGLESAPSDRLPVDAINLSLVDPNGNDKKFKKSGDEVAAQSVPLLALGSLLKAPESILCGLEGTPSLREVPILQIGEAVLRCSSKSGEAKLPIRVDGQALRVNKSKSQVVSLGIGEENTLSLVSDTPLPPRESLRVHVAPQMGLNWKDQHDNGIKAEIVEVENTKIRIRVQSTGVVKASSQIHLIHQSAAGPIPLAAIAIKVGSPPRSISKEQLPTMFVRVGAGVWESQWVDNATNGTSPLAFARLEYRLTERFFVDGQTSLGRSFIKGNHWIASNQLGAGARFPITAGLSASARAAAVLWYNNSPAQSSLVKLGAAASLGIDKQLGFGSIGAEIGSFLGGQATKRLFAGISYSWAIDAP